MNKADLISAVAQKSGLTKKDSEAAIDAFVAVFRGFFSKGRKGCSCWLRYIRNKEQGCKKRPQSSDRRSN